MPSNARRVEAFVNVETVEFVIAQNETVRAGTLVRSLGVYANVRTVVHVLTLIHVETSVIVRAQHVARLASAAMRADKINADVGAFAVVLHTFIDIDA